MVELKVAPEATVKEPPIVLLVAVVVPVLISRDPVKPEPIETDETSCVRTLPMPVLVTEPPTERVTRFNVSAKPPTASVPPALTVRVVVTTPLPIVTSPVKVVIDPERTVTPSANDPLPEKFWAPTPAN